MLPLTFALPDWPYWLFELLTFTVVELLLVKLLLPLLELIRFTEPGPVVLILDAWASPTPTVTASAPLAASLMSRFFKS